MWIRFSKKFVYMWCTKFWHHKAHSYIINNFL